MLLPSHPTCGSVGLTEPQAREKYGDANIKVYKSNFIAMYFSVFSKQEDKEPTAYKLICAGEDEKVVGIHIVGQGSDEITQGFAVAVKMGARKRDLDDTVAIHPTSSGELAHSPLLACPLERELMALSDSTPTLSPRTSTRGVGHPQVKGRQGSQGVLKVRVPLQHFRPLSSTITRPVPSPCQRSCSMSRFFCVGLASSPARDPDHE